MISFLKSLFKKKHKKLDTNNILDGNSNYLVVFMDKNGEPNIYMNLGDRSESAPEKFGNIIFSLNEGHYVSSIIDILISISKTDKEALIFINKIITTWSDQIKENSISIDKVFNDNPIILPTQFSNHIK